MKRAATCNTECYMFGPEQPEGPGSCRESCRLLRGEPKVEDAPPVSDALYAMARAAVTLTGDVEGMILAGAAETASKLGATDQMQAFRRTLIEHTLTRLDEGLYDTPDHGEAAATEELIYV